MTNTKHLLNRVNTIIENSNSDTLTEIKNISDILEVNGKVATVLHFVNKDSDWNPHTLTLLDDLLKEEKLTEFIVDLCREKVHKKVFPMAGIFKDEGFFVKLEDIHISDKYKDKIKVDNVSNEYICT